jgi:hypothetical protein
MQSSQVTTETSFVSKHHVVPTVDYVQAAAFCAERGAHLDPQSGRGWIVRRMPESRGVNSVLGCVEDLGDHVELMRLREGTFSWATFDTLSQAVKHLLAQPMDPSDGDAASEGASPQSHPGLTS